LRGWFLEHDEEYDIGSSKSTAKDVDWTRSDRLLTLNRARAQMRFSVNPAGYPGDPLVDMAVFGWSVANTLSKSVNSQNEPGVLIAPRRDTGASFFRVRVPVTKEPMCPDATSKRDRATRPGD
jgi:hypothetical protein